MFYLSKNKLHWNQKKKRYIKCWKCPLRSAMHAFTLFLMLDANRWRVPVSRKRFTRRDIVDLFGTGESGNVSLTHSGKLSKNEMPGSVRQWTLFALVKKTSLPFDCWKTTDGLARAGYNMTWPAWALVVTAMCVFINPIELYWIAAIYRYFNVGYVTFRSSRIYAFTQRGKTDSYVLTLNSGHPKLRQLSNQKSCTP
jgi:hypothetical protein